MSSESFLAQAAQLDGVSVSVEDEQYVATCEEQADGKIDTSQVHDKATESGLRISNSIADFDAGHVRVFVPKGGGA